MFMDALQEIKILILTPQNWRMSFLRPGENDVGSEKSISILFSFKCQC